MKPYFVEGLFLPREVAKRAYKNTKKTTSGIEPFAKTIWANSLEEALRLATDEIHGGAWVDGPSAKQRSEEQRMRASGAPEFPGFSSLKSKKRNG